MANDLTGDFDVVAQFSTAAANRILAAMHRAERFPHALSLRVDDIPTSGLKGNPVILGSVDRLGDVTVNPDHVKPVHPGAWDAFNPALDRVVNPDVIIGAAGPIVPSDLQGRAQVQVSAPTLEVSDGAGSRVTVRIDMMSRYFPDPHTAPLAEFIRGQLQISAPVGQMGSGAAQVVDVDFRSPDVVVNFTANWLSSPLALEDVAAINLLIRNALRTSFLPSNTVIPPRIRHLQFKTFSGPPSAIAVLLNIYGGPGNRASANRLFLGGGDDFAYGAGIDFVRAAFQPTLDRILAQPIAPISVSGIGTYTVQLNGAAVDLVPGRIVLMIRGRAESPALLLPNFNFEARQVITLVVDGSTADFIAGDLTLKTSSTIINVVKGLFMGRIEKIRDRALAESNAHQTVRQLLSADENLGVFLNSLFTPPGGSLTQPQAVHLAYTSVDIQPSGIVLHGTLGVSDWPPAHVEFELIPSQSGVGDFGTSVTEGPEYSALKSWIPGGVIQQYEWHRPGQAQPFIDPGRFVLLPQSPEASGAIARTRFSPGYDSLCLTVRGVRLSASGPVAAQSVSATTCGFNSFPVISSLVANAPRPMVALVERDPHGLIHVTGHTSARTDPTGAGIPNLLIHFADDASAARLDMLAEALRESGRDTAAAAVVVVLNRDQLKGAPYVAGITYADNQNAGWNDLFEVKPGRRATTLIVRPDSKIVWRHEGEIAKQALTAALREHLDPRKAVPGGALRSNVRIGHPPPNLLFEYAPGRTLPLRKLSGRPAVLGFWTSSSPASIDAVRDLQSAQLSGEKQALVLAINDGDDPDIARKVAADNGLSAILVTDPDRKISEAYGVTIWPTIIDVDALGVVRGVRYGRPVGNSRGVTQHG